jgi:hypothetical protein
MLIVRNDPRCRCPSQRPSGIAISSEMLTPIALTFNVSSVRCSRLGSCGLPGTLPSRAMNLKASTKSFMSSSLRAPRPHPRRQQSLDAHQQAVGEQRQQDRQAAGRDQLGLERTLAESRVDRHAEPLVADGVGDRRQ